MDTKRLEKFAPEARFQMIEAVEQRMYLYSLDDEGRAANPAQSDIVRKGVLTTEEKAKRAELFRRVEEQGVSAFAEQMAYTWFNRFVAIRFMEIHGYLPCRVRILSSAEDTFDPECLRVAASLDLPGLDSERVLAYIQAGDDEALYRDILVAQADELATCMPDVFGRVGGADVLMLPDGLTRKDAGNVLFRLVTELPESEWDQVEILGWLYQFYNAERKADFFKSKRKAAREDLAPATQLFTPDWIVRYMVENSLGRLWILNNPDSRLRERMDYYIEPDGEREDFRHIDGPEDITFCDPACGSGHILVYAFQLLFAMYEERGYVERDIPELILSKNLTGYEVDERAGQLASLALTMCAREHDRRFFKRDVVPNIRVFSDIVIDAGALDPDGALVGRTDLLDALAHLGEVGSLLNPTLEDVDALRAEAMRNLSGDLFAGRAGAAVDEALDACTALSTRFDVVVANPPYMGSSSFNPWMSKWVKKNYPDVKSDLFSAFIVRIMDIAKDGGEAGIMCPFVWMFIGSYEKLRNRMIDEKTITSLVQLEYSGFAGATVPICTFTFHNAHISGYKGGYVRLSDFVGPDNQAPKALEAIANPDCGYFYRADATAFHDIPGTPIAYWASEAVHRAFRDNPSLASIARPVEGIKTGNNDLYLHLWHEVGRSRERLTKNDNAAPWIAMCKGGPYRKWYGNLDYVCLWGAKGEFLSAEPKAAIGNANLFHTPCFNWTYISSGKFAARMVGPVPLYNNKGPACYSDITLVLFALGAMNSSFAQEILDITSPTLDYKPGGVGLTPIAQPKDTVVDEIVSACIEISKSDWDSQETSWDFMRHSLV